LALSKSIHAAIVIPARYDSSRFPGKPLALIQGISMIERVWRIAQKCTQADAIYITTDSDIIFEKASSFGAQVIMTSAACPTGTDRVAEAAESFAQDNTIIISLQGDAVLTPPWIVDDIIIAMKKDPETMIATPAVKLISQALVDFLNHKKISPSSGTTVVFDKNYQALYFSKQPIPYQRTVSHNAILYRHIGLYGYRFKTLKVLNKLEQTPLECIEKLEQLRALENGIPIRIVCVDYQGRTHASVDTPEDLQVVERLIEQEGELI
jgi:3-deoxy-manno-octulosonate cytidylyltransferase (CMP-KDO synthetase)